MYSPAVDNLITQLARLPGIGRRTAQRLAFFILRSTPEQALAVIPKLPTLYSEPFADSSQIPTFLVSQLARQQVTVSLSGDAGDELFAGYSRYVLTRKLWSRIQHLPLNFRRLAAVGICSLSPTTWNTLLRPLLPLMPPSLRQANVGDKLHKGAGILDSPSVDALYMGLITHWDSNDLVLDSHGYFNHLDEIGRAHV